MSLGPQITAMVEDREGAPGARSGRARIWRALVRSAALVLLIAGSAYLGGFLVFADQVANARLPADPRADGIVALTGGAHRIEDAAALLERGSAERLLISGVNEATSARALTERVPHLDPFMPCCVDIGREARDTRGNAAETREWAERLGYRSLIVVTSAWHMPRSLAELRRELPSVALVPYPINPDGRDFGEWPRDVDLLKLLLLEYTKYLVARLG